METIIGKEIRDHRHQQKCYGHAHRQSKDVDGREHFVSENTPARGLEITCNHDPVDKEFKEFWLPHRVQSE